MPKLYNAHLYWYCSINLHTLKYQCRRKCWFILNDLLVIIKANRSIVFCNIFVSLFVLVFWKIIEIRAMRFILVFNILFIPLLKYLSYSISFIIFNIQYIKKEHHSFCLLFVKMVYIYFSTCRPSRPIIISWAFVMGMCTWSTLLFPLYHSLLF